MVIFLIRTAIFLGSAALGILAAALIVPEFVISSFWGFLLAIVIFAVLQSIFTPWFSAMAEKNASWLLGGIGIVSTFAALAIVDIFHLGIEMNDLLAWILGPIVVWLVTALATWILPGIFLKKRLAARSAK